MNYRPCSSFAETDRQAQEPNDREVCHKDHQHLLQRTGTLRGRLRARHVGGVPQVSPGLVLPPLRSVLHVHVSQSASDSLDFVAGE